MDLPAATMPFMRARYSVIKRLITILIGLQEGTCLGKKRCWLRVYNHKDNARKQFYDEFAWLILRGTIRSVAIVSYIVGNSSEPRCVSYVRIVHSTGFRKLER